MATKSTVQKLAPRQAPQTTALQTLRQNFSIELAPFPEGDKALVFQSAATAITVSDQGTHREALETMRQGKALKRGIDEHWQRVLRWLEARKVDIRNIREADLALVEPGLAHLTSTVLAYEDAEKRRQAAEEDRQRRENERKAQIQREKDLADLDAKALAAEAVSEGLSDRERRFVEEWVVGPGVWLEDPPMAARKAGYKDWQTQGDVLLGRPKIQAAIQARSAALALREQQAAVQEKPLEVKAVEVQSNLAKVAGTRTVVTWTGECIDRDALIDAVLKGMADRDLLIPNQVAINALAREQHENLDRIPGLRHIRKETKAG